MDIYQEDLDTFLAIANELELRGITEGFRKETTESKNEMDLPGLPFNRALNFPIDGYF